MGFPPIKVSVRDSGTTNLEITNRGNLGETPGMGTTGQGNQPFLPLGSEREAF
jgi:hypothetical protein